MANNLEINLVRTTDRSTVIPLNLFWFGFIVYIASYTISNTDEVNYVICNFFQILGLMVMLPSSVFLISFRIENNYLRVVFFIYCLWLVSVIFRGIRFDYESIKQLLFDPGLGIFLYLTPLVLLIPVSGATLRKVYEVIIILSAIYIIYNLIFIRQLLFPYENMRSQAIAEYFTQYLSLAGGFFLLTYIYHTRKSNLFILFTIVLTLIIAVLRARRGLIFMSFSMLFFSYFIYQFVNKKRIINIILSLFLILVVAYAVARIYSENRKDTFSLITERIGQRTRNEVEQYFYGDLKTTDWIIGRGINGEYFCPGVTEGIGRVTIYRRVIETGFLQVVLNGGIISLSLMLLIAVPAMIKGLFMSRNILSKVAGIWILLFLIYMYPGTLTKFSLHYMLVWISIGICYSAKIRSLSDDTIKFLLGNRDPRPFTSVNRGI